MHFAVPGFRVIEGAWRWTGLLPVLVGLGLNLVADQAFKRHNTTVKPFQESTALVRDGVFHLTRNPMYVGIVLMLAGVALLAGSATPWIAVVAFGVLIDRRFVRSEEAMLEETFGEEFRRYKREVRRWI
jgi:protein-S-isoprenylcysteine O-methyltransferase Ste14